MARRVLIVDDNATNRLILKEMLKKDYEILEATGGEEALVMLAARADSISAVLLDISMPGMDGYEVLNKIRYSKQLNDMPVIMVTASEDKETRIKSLALGANDFVLKPYSPEILRHCLQNNIALHEAASTVSALQRDKLTGLYGRESFFDKVREMVTAHEPGYYVMACFDIEKFKVINDQYGLQKGDEVLQHTADSFREGFEPVGGICCRIFADNFAVFYPTAFQDAPELAAIREKASHVAGLISPIQFCIGRYIVDDITMPPAAMYDRAVLAAASVKGRYDERIARYNDVMREQLMREQEIVSEMEAALKTGQFEVWFQPQYNHATDARIGAEALVRWRHPKKGLISPNDFIYIFERNGFIYPLDKFVWEEVCRSLCQWLEAGKEPLPISVNISRYDIVRPDIVDVLNGLVKKYRLPIDLLRLEITESAFSESSQHIVEAVKELLTCGFTVEIDDFGSGYSSLNTLKDVPAQIIKLDMKFLESGSDSLRGGNIVESVVRMAKWLGMSVIAEGVETREQADYLRSIGCYYMQGYLYARPMPAEEYERHCSGRGKEEHLLTLETVENLDNNAFWDPQSMDTLIFNSYVGGACIYEYHNGRIELLRATEKYAQMIGSAGMTVEDALKLDWSDHLDEATGKRVRQDLQSSIATRNEITGEYVFLDLPNCPHETHLRSTMRVIASAGERHLVYCTNENVTAQRQAEREAREAAEQMQTLMNDTPGGFARMRMHPDGTGFAEYVNDGFCKMRGMTKEEVLGVYAHDLMVGVHPDDYDLVSSEIARAIATEGLMNAKYRLQNKTGEYVWMQVFARFVKAASGDTIINCYYADLSELEKRELNLRETMPFILSAIMESSENLDFAKDKDFNYVCCSPAFVKFTRQESEADVIGKNDYDFWTKEEADHFRSDDIRLFEGGESLINFVEPIPSDDNVQHYSVTSKYILRDSTGEIIGLYGSGRDITDTRAALDRLQLLTDSVPGGIATYAVSPDSMKITYFNDGFCDLFGCTREEYNAFVSEEGVVSLVFPEDLPTIMEQLAALMADGSPMDCIYRSYRFDRTGYRWLNLRGVLVSRHDDTVFINAVLYDVTAQREAESRSRNLAEQMSSIMDSISCGVSAFSIEGDRFEKHFVNDKYYSLIGYSREEFEAEVKNVFDTVYPPDRRRVYEIAQEANEVGKITELEYRIMRRNGTVIWVKSTISTRGFEGIERPVQVTIFTDITTEKLAEQKLKAAAEQVQNMMDDMPGGFVRMSIAPDGAIKPVYVNDGFVKLIDTSRDEIMSIYANDSLAGVHPDDIGVVNDVVARMFKNGKAQSARYRLMRGDGSYIWLSVFGRATGDAAGNTFLNIYYTDASEQMREEETQKSLLDNLPGGAGIYEFKDGQLSLTYQNKSYWALVGLDQEAYPDPAPMSAVHPDDIPVIMRELAAAIEQDRDVVCNIRLRHLTKGYCPVRLAGRIVHEETGGFLVYVSFSPTDQADMTYQQTLPRLLSTIMEASNDYVFAKDKALRYLCCSPAFLRIAGLEDERDVIGKTDFELFPTDMAEQFRKNDLALFASNEPLVDFDETIHDPDGTLHYCLASKHILRDAAGESIGVYGISRDITKERSAFEQLRLVNDSLPGGIATYSVRRDRVRITYCNDGFGKLFGGTREGIEARDDLDPMDWVLEEDRAALQIQIRALVRDDVPMDAVFRICALDNSIKWINEKATVAEHRGDTVLFNAILLDITEQQDYNERLRISEEENNLAVQHGGSVVCRYDIADRSLTVAPAVAAAYSIAERITDVPDEPVRLGLISPESADAYIGFFEAILNGGKAGSVLYQQRYFGDWRWIEAKSSTIFSGDGKPVKAVISLFDATERLEKETIYKKWQHSLEDRAADSYTLFRCNLNKNTGYETKEGTLFSFNIDDAGFSFNDRANAYANACVHEDDRGRYLAFLNSDAMLAGYYRGKRSDALDYRELLPGGGERWLRLSVDLVEYPNSTDVEAYLMFENIDKVKKTELQTKQLSETDPLTGILNRATFAARVNRILSTSGPETKHALLMLDIDGFKQVNDVFGHAAGDQTLMELADGMRSLIRGGDLLARLGGDEFVVFMVDVPDVNAAVTKAKQIRALARKSFSLEVQISASVGIACSPLHGVDFDALYKKADSALYYVKGSGKDSQAVYADNMADEHLAPEPDTYEAGSSRPVEKRRRMLIVDDNSIDHALLERIFRDEFLIEKAQDGASALIRLRHYGSAISIVLLDLMMPGMNGFAVLEKMQESFELRSIPVIIVSGDESRETCLTAIRKGATDFITKPIDVDLLRIRVHSAVSKAENERLRAKNCLLEMQSQEIQCYESFLESPGIAFMEYHCLTGKFRYYPSVFASLAGTYNDRPLWEILRADLVAETKTAQDMQQLVRHVAEARNEANSSMCAILKTPRGQKHRFRFDVRKTANDDQLAHRLIISLVDLDYETTQ